MLGRPDSAVGGDRQALRVAVAVADDLGCAGVRIERQDLAVVDVRVVRVDGLLDLAVVVDAEVADGHQQCAVAGELEDAAGLVEMGVERRLDARLGLEDGRPGAGGARPGPEALEAELRDGEGVARPVGMRVVVRQEDLPAALGAAHLETLGAHRAAVLSARN